MEDRIWRLHICGNKYLGLIPLDLDYFHAHFIGKPMPQEWSAPPVTVSGKSKKLPDFVSWMTKAPIVSERAKLALSPVVSDYVQFFPFHDVKGKKFYAMNVTHVETEILDLERSEIAYSSTEPKVVLMIERAFFVEKLPANLPPIFKISILPNEVEGDVFVTKTFAEVAIEAKLTGIALADPQQDSFKSVLANKSQNVVPGIVE